MRVFPGVMAFGLGATAHAHMEMKYPPPLRSRFNPYVAEPDFNMVSPLKADGSDYPCKGHAKLLGTPEGKPVTQWVAGNSYSMAITGNTVHNGGSCQASASFDRGSTWRVLHSYIGNCPVAGESHYNFSLPSDTPSGGMLFAWTWFNQVGNREMYMNCAAVTVTGGNRSGLHDTDSLSTRPFAFAANVGNGMCTFEGKDVEFPQPGPNVTRNSRGTHAPGRGACLGWVGN